MPNPCAGPAAHPTDRLVGQAPPIQTLHTQIRQLAAFDAVGKTSVPEESVQTLIETQAFVGEPGAYRLAQARPIFSVPARVQTVLAARIDHLSPETKHLLQTAAVIGHEVSRASLQAVANLSAAGLHRGLAQLQGGSFRDETRRFPEPAYTVTHALTHEVAYGSLFQERRRTLHARLVEVLEGCSVDRLGPPGRVSCRAWEVRRGQGIRGRRAADC
jgi:adenylate cyclase